MDTPRTCVAGENVLVGARRLPQNRCTPAPVRPDAAGIRHQKMPEVTHHSFIAYALPTIGEVVPMVARIAPALSLPGLLVVINLAHSVVSRS